jgi:dUTP pyrophosphatase
MVLNSPGTVDQGYTGEVKVILMNINNMAVTVEKGQKVAQGVLCPVESGKKVSLVEDDFEDKERGSNGFGSTGI